MGGSGGSDSASRAGRVIALWGAMILVGAATAVLVLSDDARLLRLGIVAALWAALIGAFALARLRRRVERDEDREHELQRVYQLELEREVAARREYELEVENEVRRRVSEESAAEVQALRAELHRLRENLEPLLSGDLLVERVALRAESTRLRALAGQGGNTQRMVPADGGGRGRTLAPAGSAASGGTVNGSSGNGNSNGSGQSARWTGLVSGHARDAGHIQPGGHVPDPEHLRGEPEAAARAPGAGRGKAGPGAGGPYDGRAAQQGAPASPVGGEQRPDTPWPDEGTPAEQTGEGYEDRAAQDVLGAHTEGTSVNDLLAAYGNWPEQAGRRRRHTE